MQLSNNEFYRFTRTSFLCACPGISPQRRFALVVTNFVSLISVLRTKSLLTPLFLLSPKSLSTFRGPRRSWQSHIPFGRLFSCHIPNVPLDRQRDGRKVAFWMLRFFLICGGSYQITELLKNHPPQVVGIESTQKLSDL